MEKAERIFVAGYRGMVGAALCRKLKSKGYHNVITRDRDLLDLADRAAVSRFFGAEHPNYVFLAAAKVGGILTQTECGGDFIRENLHIQTNVIDAAYRHGTKKLLFLGSSCVYPKDAKQPFQEDAFLTGSPEHANLPYAVSKIAGKVMCDAYRRQYGFDAFTVTPSNVYGIGDNFDPNSAHVVAGLMRRMHEAKEAGVETVVAWGSGNQLRELIFADDLADACVFLMNHYEDGGMINVGSSHEASIRDLTNLIADIVGFKGRIKWDPSKPDGNARKIMNNSRLNALGWKSSTTIHVGLEKMYEWFCRFHGKGSV